MDAWRGKAQADGSRVIVERKPGGGLEVLITRKGRLTAGAPLDQESADDLLRWLYETHPQNPGRKL